ncbi:hypothetical protein [Lactiplantibacillus plantarum]|uniref:hypothetical protein n=1 Tax=Lactiplantibacillus plantarum TaxID=1590 RepID=UPI000AF8A15A|nr:hypothetical protein [Lactiplantibacillus plantarum]MCG0834587.1 hypothetical protein [Lactiplantibacillus plantarum]WKF78316.1 hypothetical protein QY877_11650 [Lactiplantibacillus plantarum]BEI48750.1 hypothetical protein AWA2013_01560 [Lactiplantibacillus plantarum]
MAVWTLSSRPPCKSKATALTKLDIAKLKIKELEARNKYLEMEKDLSKKLKEIQKKVK